MEIIYYLSILFSIIFLFIICYILFLFIDKKFNKKSKKRSIDKISEIKTIPRDEIKGSILGMPDITIDIFKEQIQRKNNWKDFERILQLNNINVLYHITDKSNLESIFQYNFLCSWLYANFLGIKINRPGGNELSRNLDKSKRVSDYVRLAFTTNLPMIYSAKSEGRIPNPYVLKFRVDPIYFIATKYCPINATDNNALCNDRIDTFKKIRFDIIKQNNFIDDTVLRKYKQAEVLIQTKLDLNYLIEQPCPWRG